MLYHVIIALNSAGKRKVGEVVSLLEKKGLDFVDIKKKVTPSGREFPDINLLVLQTKLNELKEMEFYLEKFSLDVLHRKINHFYGNHVELFFESEGKFIEPYALWKAISQKAFSRRKLPLMFVVVGADENGVYTPFVPSMDCMLQPFRVDLRTIVPIGRK